MNHMNIRDKLVDEDLNTALSPFRHMNYNDAPQNDEELVVVAFSAHV